jgi:hypothetical protein
MEAVPIQAQMINPRARTLEAAVRQAEIKGLVTLQAQTTNLQAAVRQVEIKGLVTPEKVQARTTILEVHQAETMGLATLETVKAQTTNLQAAAPQAEIKGLVTPETVQASLEARQAETKGLATPVTVQAQTTIREAVTHRVRTYRFVGLACDNIYSEFWTWQTERRRYQHEPWRRQLVERKPRVWQHRQRYRQAWRFVKRKPWVWQHRQRYRLR